MVEQKNEDTGVRAPPENNTPVSNGNNNDTIKYCSKCGTSVENNDKFCGNCGYSLNGYQNNNYQNNPNYGYNYKKVPTPGQIEFKPIIIGGLIAFGLSFLIGFLSVFFMWGVSFWTFIAIGFIVTLICLFIGGLYAGLTAKSQGGTHGMYAGLVYTLISIVLNAILGIPTGFIGILIAVMIGMGMGGLGGFVGSKLKKVDRAPYPVPSQTYYG